MMETLNFPHSNLDLLEEDYHGSDRSEAVCGTVIIYIQLETMHCELSNSTYSFVISRSDELEANLIFR